MKKLWLKARLLLASILGKSDKFILRHADIAIEYTAQIKKFVDSNFVHLIVTLTPTRIDDIALPVVSRIMDKIIVQLAIVKGCTDLPTEEERRKCFIEAVRTLSRPMQEALYLKFASLFTKESTQIQLPTRVFDTAVQTKFVEKFPV